MELLLVLLPLILAYMKFKTIFIDQEFFVLTVSSQGHALRLTPCLSSY